MWKCILRRAMKFVSVRSSYGNLSLFELVQTSKTTIYRPQTFELKSISKYQLLFHWKSVENIWSFKLYLEAGETQLINTSVVPFAIAELGQKCLEAASTLKYEPLNSWITVHSVWIMKIFNVMLPDSCSRHWALSKDGSHRWPKLEIWPSALLRITFTINGFVWEKKQLFL